MEPSGYSERSLIALAIFGALAIVILGLFKTIPGSFLPEEDQGYFITIVQLPEGASKTRTIEVLKKIENYFMANPAIHSTDVLAGQNFVFGTRGTNQATMFVPLQHWDTRPDPSDQVPGLIAAALGEFAKIPEALILAFNAPSIPGLGSTGGFSLQLQDPAGRLYGVRRSSSGVCSQAVEYPAIAVPIRISALAPAAVCPVDASGQKRSRTLSEVFDPCRLFWNRM